MVKPGSGCLYGGPGSADAAEAGMLTAVNGLTGHPVMSPSNVDSSEQTGGRYCAKVRPYAARRRLRALRAELNGDGLVAF